MTVLVPSSRPSITVAGVLLTDLANLKVLAGPVSGALRTTLRELTGTIGYQVPADHTFNVWAVQIWRNDATATRFILAYTDNDVVINTATAFTNPIAPVNNSTVGYLPVNNAGPGYPFEYPMAGKWKVPADKYISYEQEDAKVALMHVYGYEVAV